MPVETVNFNLTNLIFGGMLSFPTGTKTLELRNMKFVSATNPNQVTDFNWNTFFSRYTQLNNLTLQNTSIGIMPSVLPSTIHKCSITHSARLNGTMIPPSMLASVVTTTGPFNFSFNGFVGQVPFQFISSSALSHLDLSHNLFSLLPSNGLCNHSLEFPKGLNIDLSHNLLQGPWPPNLLYSCWNAPFLIVNASHNRISGSFSFPGTYDWPDSIPPSPRVSLKLDNNLISEIDVSEPIYSLDASSNKLTSLTSDALTIFGFLYLSQNPTLPRGDILSLIGLSRVNMLLDISSCNFTADLDEFVPKNETVFLPPALRATHNHLYGSIPMSWEDSFPVLLDLSYNIGVNGSIPEGYFSTDLSVAPKSLIAIATSLSGTMPPIYNVTSPLTLSAKQDIYYRETKENWILDLSLTNINFCEADWPWNLEQISSPTGTTFSCNLAETTATQCATLWPQCSFLPPPCHPSLPPEVGMECVNGSWVSPPPVLDPLEAPQTPESPVSSAPSLTIPSGSTIAVNGNLNASSVVFQGLGSSIVITDGCPTRLSSITVELSPKDLEKIEQSKGKKLTQTLLVLDSRLNCANLNGIRLNQISKKSGCKKVKVEKTTRNDSSKTSISAVFTIDSSGCNVWWIALVSTIGGVIIIGAIILTAVLLTQRHKRLNKKAAVS